MLNSVKLSKAFFLPTLVWKLKWDCELCFFQRKYFSKNWQHIYLCVFFTLVFLLSTSIYFATKFGPVSFCTEAKLLCIFTKKCFSTDDIYRKTQTVLNTRRLTFLHLECLFFILEKNQLFLILFFLESTHFNFGVLESGKWREIVWRRSRLANSTMLSASSIRITTERSGQRNWEQSSDTSDRIRQRRSFRYKIGLQLLIPEW